MTGSIDTSVSPYYDDFDEDKSFHRMLFIPGRAVQARELTQLQTILQNQITRFGQNIFKDGTTVVPGGVVIDIRYEYLRLQETDISTAIVGDTLTGQTSGNTARLLQKVESDSADPATFYVDYTSGGRFQDGETIVVSGTGSGSFTAEASNATGQGTKLNLSKGIFFIKGFFVAAVTQSIIVEKYGIPTGTVEVGLTVTENIVTSDNDSSILSNAQGTTNFNAPGADRLRVTATLALKSEILESNGETSDDYISLALIQDGVIVEKYLNTQYNILGDEIARRTFDESGNYTTDPFIVDIEEHASDTTKLSLIVDPGKAYVRGFEIEKNTITQIDIDKALSTEVLNNGRVATTFGNYVRTQAPTYLPNLSQFQQVNLVDAGAATIGTARVRAVTRESASIYRFYLFEVSLNANESFNEVRTLSSGSFTTTLVDDNNAALSTNIAELKDTANNNLLFPIQQSRVFDITDITVRAQRYTTGTTDGSGNVTLNTGSANVTWAETSGWVVIRDDTGAVVGPSFGATGSQTIQLSGLTASQSHTIIAFVDKTTASTNARSKTLTTKTDEPLSSTSGTNDIFLDEFDIYQVTSIKDAADNTDITDRYIIDGGQRDNFYEEGRLILRSGEAAPTGDSVSEVLVTFSYFEHGGSGDYFNVDSYDGFVSTNSYGEIPEYTLTDGTTLRLADVFDFRPRKDDTNANFSGTGSVVHELPQINETIQADIEYYLPRVDILHLDRNGNFGISEGQPALIPETPEFPNDVMPIYFIALNAGTIDNLDVSTFFIDNKRYTMRDIGRIETRIMRLEEITTLSLLEVEVDALEVLDNSGNARFKSGFFVDNFVSHSFSDVDNIEYRAAVNIDEGLLRPQSTENNARLIYKATASDSLSSSNVTRTGDVLTLSYTEVVEFTQPYATEGINVNPYAIVTNIGSIELSPRSDEWRDVETRTRTVTQVRTGRVDNRQINNDNNWLWNWLGTQPGLLTRGGNRRDLVAF